MIREEIIKLLEGSITYQKKYANLGFKVEVEVPPKKEFGDYDAHVLRPTDKIFYDSAGKKFAEFKEDIQSEEDFKRIEKEIKEEIKKSSYFRKIFKDVKFQIPVFFNFFIKEEYLQNQVKEILKVKDKFGNLKIGRGQKINVEFISANPTGPLTLGNGRGGFCGDVLSNILEKAGYKVTREYYINDVGEQVKKLGHSVIGDSEAVYKGDYIDELRKRIKGDNPEKVGEASAKIILEKMIKPTIEKDMKIKFDVWFSEKSLYEKKETGKILCELKKKNLTYEKDGALWLRTTQFDDDKDRVLIKSDGSSTYCFQDIAYLKNKFKRGFKKLIFFWGADHYGYIGRIKAAVEALGYKKEQADFIIMQLVRLFEKGREVRMSKRAGNYITLDELIEEVGLDVARFFFLTRSPETHFDFDMDLAKEQSKKNPVYYVQYAHARICSILRKCKMQNANLKMKIQNLKLLNHKSELELIKQLIRLPEIIESTTKDYQVQRLPNYAIDLADTFHRFYEDCMVLVDDLKLKEARLALILATKITIENTLDLMGISAPEKM